MSDVSNARIDYPHVPRALLEWCDFYTSSSVQKPHIKAGKRDAVAALLVLGGMEINQNTGNVVCPLTRGVVLTATTIWLKDINQFFKERDLCRT